MKRAAALALVLAGAAVGLLGNPLSGTTLLAGVLITGGGYWLIGLCFPTSGTITLDEACDLLDQQRQEAPRA